MATQANASVRSITEATRPTWARALVSEPASSTSAAAEALDGEDRHHRIALRALVVTFVVALAAGAYAAPRLVDLIRLPGELDAAVAAANRYNPGLAQVVELESGTAGTLAELDRVGESLAHLRQVVGRVHPELESIVARIGNDAEVALASSVQEVRELLVSLDALESELRALGIPVGEATAIIAEARQALQAIVAAAASAGAEVARARLATERTADNVAGPKRG